MQTMSPKEITSLGEAAAKAAKRAMDYGKKLGNDQNRGQFAAMMKAKLEAIPESLRGEAVQDFLRHEAVRPFD